MSAAYDINELTADLVSRREAHDAMIDWEFIPQANFITDDASRKAALCTRRAGKSFGIASDFIADSFHHPGASYLYMALTRLSAKAIMWDDVLKQIDKAKGLSAKFNEAELEMRLPNGARIMLYGADSTKGELEKKLGGKPRKVVVDEAGSFKQDLEKLLIEVLEPAVTDMEGQICMIGTPTELTGTYFHQITSGELDHGWSIHRWNTFANPHMTDKWRKQIKRLRQTYGDVLEQLPWFRRMYLGEWVTDHESLVYKFDPRRNTIDALPEARYTYLMGIDLGFDDPTAFVLGAYNNHQKNLYILETYKRSGMTISDVADRIRYYQQKYDIYDMVIDNASKQAVEELKQRFDLPLEAAEKTGKAEFIEIMNSEFIQGKIKLVDGEATAPLADEYQNLIWDEDKKPKREEHPRCENHLCDAALYMWRKHLAYMSEPPIQEPETDEERIEQWEEQEALKIEMAKQGDWGDDHL